MPDQFRQQLRHQLAKSQPGRMAHRPFAHELSYGRHQGPAPSFARQAAVLATLHCFEGVWTIPMIKRPDGSEIHARQICLPGGGIEGNETNTQAALRECREEIGWCPRESEIVGQLSPIYVYASNNLVTPVVAVSEETPRWTLNAAEVAELVELPMHHLCSAASLGEIELHRHSLTMKARCFTWQGHDIWGATAMILSELRQVLLAGRDERVDCGVI